MLAEIHSWAGLIRSPLSSTSWELQRKTETNKLTKSERYVGNLQCDLQDQSSLCWLRGMAWGRRVSLPLLNLQGSRWKGFKWGVRQFEGGWHNTGRGCGTPLLGKGGEEGLGKAHWGSTSTTGRRKASWWMLVLLWLGMYLDVLLSERWFPDGVILLMMKCVPCKLLLLPVSVKDEVKSIQNIHLAHPGHAGG